MILVQPEVGLHATFIKRTINDNFILNLWLRSYEV